MPVVPDSLTQKKKSRKALQLQKKWTGFRHIRRHDTQGRQAERLFHAGGLQHNSRKQRQIPLIYHGNKYGAAIPAYYSKITARFAQAADKIHMPVRIPEILGGYGLTPDKLCIMLEHMDYNAHDTWQKNSLGYAAYMLSRKKMLQNGLPGLISRDSRIFF